MTDFKRPYFIWAPNWSELDNRLIDSRETEGVILIILNYTVATQIQGFQFVFVYPYYYKWRNRRNTLMQLMFRYPTLSSFYNGHQPGAQRLRGDALLAKIAHFVDARKNDAGSYLPYKNY